MMETSVMETYAHSFIRGIGGAYDLGAPDLARLAPTLQGHVERAQKRWPGVEVPGEDYAAHLARCAPESDDPADALASMHTEDLYLALACARGDELAIATLESNVMIHAPKAIARVDPMDSFVTEAVAEVRIKLLVGDDRPPKILAYAGRGPLSSWVMVTAVRVAYDMKRKRQQEVSCEQPGLELAFDDEPALRILRAQVKAPFTVAFRAALAALDAKERNVLRLYLIEDVSAEAIGKMYGVHRATVARWIGAARHAVQKETRVRLRAQLRIGDSTFDSLMQHLSLKLDVSLVSNLGSAT